MTREPGHPDLGSLATVAGAGGRRLIVGGWWRLVRLSIYNIYIVSILLWYLQVRHPTYTGEILVQWSWVLPLGGILQLNIGPWN